MSYESPIFDEDGNLVSITACCDICQHKCETHELKWPMPGYMKIPASWTLITAPHRKDQRLVCDRHEITIGDAKEPQ